MKIFRFLADLLTSQEFNELSYYHVSRFIGTILKLAFEEGKDGEAQDAILNPISLHKFVCQALDLKYK